jgi:hypothetical protein
MIIHIYLYLAAGGSAVDEIKLQKQVRRANMWSTVILFLFIAIAGAIQVGFGIFKYQHTFTEKKWLNAPNDRTKIVADLLEKHKLIGMTEEEIISLLGEEEHYANTKTSFKISKTYFDPENSIVYYLGVDYMDVRWLIISLSNGIVSSYCLDVT